jgi:FdhD protein
MSSKKTVDIIKIDNCVKQQVTDEIIVEKVLNIYINKKYYSSLMCTPNEKIELAIGFLFAEGVISSMKSVKRVVETSENIVCVILDHNLEEDFETRKALISGCANGSMDLRILEEYAIKPVESNYKYSVNEILLMMKEFNHKSELFKQTGGVHSCSICSNSGIVYFSEDIGRHNALDKVIGKALLNNIGLEDKLLMATGRISSDIAIKAARAGIPIIVSHSAPTDMALDIAKKSNITMVGFVRGNRMSIYCGSDRIII